MATLQLNNGNIIKVSPQFKDESDIILEEFEEEDIFPVVKSSITLYSLELLDNFVNNINKNGNNESILSSYTLNNIITLYNNAIYFMMDDILNILMTEMVYRLTNEEIIESYKNNNINVISILNNLDQASQIELFEKLKYNGVNRKLKGDYYGSSKDLNAILLYNKLHQFSPPKITKLELPPIEDYDDPIYEGVNDLYQVIVADNERHDNSVHNIMTNEELKFNNFILVSRDGSKILHESSDIFSFPSGNLIDNLRNNLDNYELINENNISPNFNFITTFNNEISPFLRIKNVNTQRYIFLDSIEEPVRRVLNKDYRDNLRYIKINYSASEKLVAINYHDDEGKILILIIDTNNGNILYEIVLNDDTDSTYEVSPSDNGLFYIKYDNTGNERDMDIFYMKYSDNSLVKIGSYEHYPFEIISGLNEQLLISYESNDEIIVYRYTSAQTLQKLIEFIMN